ncbi:hypothetical protein [Falsihalocynthiibacter arcticus]|uniref:ParB/Sulfiredoxin domain-containing protein n=1 Tax=Falsihalocynthiibacter arcticus TaxID=1579316 RepID=A0A126V3L8_9RHOB|nr:hypothetical protein [Falsihalocynthiibacter arcticus]AML52747.1 hypothetical protein RC74_17100 [Falsihalocynthiibacter arcticus]
MISETKFAAIERLQGELARGEAMPPSVPRSLPLEAIREEPIVFQPRKDGVDPERVEKISQDVNGGVLDEQIHVWWSGMGWIVVDGHHRMAAYRLKADRDGEKGLKAPVKVLIGHSLDQAMAVASKLNSREKDPITREEKMDSAWVLICRDVGSKKELHEWTGISQGQIGIMRALFKRLRERRKSPMRLMGMTWENARLMDKKGKLKPEWSPEQEEAMAQEWGRKLLKALGEKMRMQPEVLARAIQIVSEELPHRLIRSDAFHDGFEKAKETTGFDLLEAEGIEAGGDKGLEADF